MALVASAAAIYQPAKAQLSVSINVGSPRPIYYNDYYAQPVVHRTYYTPAPRYVYVDRNNYRHKKHYTPARVYRSSYNRSAYSRPVNRYYNVKQVNYKQLHKFAKHGRGHGKGRH